VSLAITFTDGERTVEVWHGTELWRKSMEWAKFHRLDPMQIPAGSTIEWDPVTRRMEWDEFVIGADGRPLFDQAHMASVTVRRVKQAEAPPLPFPTHPEANR